MKRAYKPKKKRQPYDEEAKGTHTRRKPEIEMKDEKKTHQNGYMEEYIIHQFNDVFYVCKHLELTKRGEIVEIVIYR